MKNLLYILLSISAPALAQDRIEKTVKHVPGKKLINIRLKEDVVFYPNPTRGKVYFSDWGTIEVRNLQGKLLKTAVDEIDLSPLPPGWYYITIYTGSAPGTTKLHLKK